ncbi:MAG: cyclopropane-fatty-acyl-phospholipid synthase family protein, partial [Pirellulaceae bacterium]
GCRVTGVTLSKVQCYWARCAAVRAGVRSRVRILRDDAEQLNFPKGSFDIVWTIECTEHFFDKPRFLERAAAWLPTGGRLAICTWLAGEDQNSERTIQQVREVCEGFFCPSLASMEEYRQWLTSAGMVVEWSANLTRQVERTWEICQSRVTGTGVRWMARLVGRNAVVFLDRFQAIREAYQTGAMQYGCLVARKCG